MQLIRIYQMPLVS